MSRDTEYRQVEADQNWTIQSLARQVHEYLDTEVDTVMVAQACFQGFTPEEVAETAYTHFYDDGGENVVFGEWI